MKELILASASPRRAELLKTLGIPFQTVPSRCREVSGRGLPAEEVAMLRARQKCEAVAVRYQDRMVLGADTVVILDGEILDKPGDRNEAERMLQRLSGRVHRVCTGMVVIDTETSSRRESLVATKVTFRHLSQEEIKGYLATDEPYDKAGGYGIQGYGALLVERIDGCYFNVVGLPLARLGEMLASLGVDLLCPDRNTM